MPKGALLMRMLRSFGKAAGEFKKAKQEAERELKDVEKSNNPDVLLVLALKSKNLNEKLEYCTRYLELNPNDIDAWEYKETILYYLGRPKDAIECTKMRTELLDTPYLLAFAPFYRANYEEAIKSFDDVLKERPDDAMAWLWKGEALVRLERYEEGIECLDKALKLGLSKVNEAKAWFGKGRALAHLERIEEAISCFNRSLGIDPGDPDVLLEKGITLLGVGESLDGTFFEYSSAGKCFYEVLEVLKTNPEHELAILAKDGKKQVERILPMWRW